MIDQPTIDLAFPIRGQGDLPADHAYQLHAAFTSKLPALHGSEDYGLHPIRGRQVGQRLMRPTAQSCITVRIAADRIPEVLPLAGSALTIAGVVLQVGPPTVRPLLPVPALRSRLVTIKCREGLSDEAFAPALRRQLELLGVSSGVLFEPVRRRTVRIKSRQIVGHEVLLEGLTAPESLAVQQSGLGGRRSMGCGIFVPVGQGS